jgi:SAM-dependent methyltransferase
MQVLLRAVFHLFTLRDADIERVAIVVDSETGIDAGTLAVLLRPWRRWLQITDVMTTSTAPTGDWLDSGAASTVQAISIITERPVFAGPWEEAVKQRGLRVLGSDYPSTTDRAAALFHEMSHHHFELGGINEWNGHDSLHGSQTLQLLSTTNCVTHFPRYMTDELRARYASLGRPLEALDIGSGPISRLRWGALEGLLHIIGVDPLLEIYGILLLHHGLDRLPSIRVDRAIAAGAERLDRHLAANSIDFAYCCNALDHVEDPPTVITQIASALRPDALFALEFATREGSRQQWQQLHQFDLFLDADHDKIMCQWRDGRLDTLVPEGVPLVLRRVVRATDDFTAVVLQHE